MDDNWRRPTSLGFLGSLIFTTKKDIAPATKARVSLKKQVLHLNSQGYWILNEQTATSLRESGLEKFKI